MALSVTQHEPVIIPRGGVPGVNADSIFPFLKLPPELQDMIITYVLGNRFLHIMCSMFLRPGLEDRLFHYTCVSKINEKQFYKEYLNPYSEKPCQTDRPCHYSHVKNNCWNHDDCDDMYRYHSKMDLSLLGVCRELYRKGTRVLYSTNTFCFNEPTYFESFYKSLTLPYKSMLRQILLEAMFHVYEPEYSEYDHDEWGYVLSPNVVQQLSGVRAVHLVIHQNPHGWLKEERSLPKDGTRGVAGLRNLVRRVPPLAALPISDRDGHSG